jgi:hypothetical protein
MKKKEFGSPRPDNQILLPFQRKRMQSVVAKQGQVSPAKSHFRKLSDSSIPLELLEKYSSPLKVSMYMNMTLHIFHSINIIKHIKEVPVVQ